MPEGDRGTTRKQQPQIESRQDFSAAPIDGRAIYYRSNGGVFRQAGGADGGRDLSTAVLL